MTSRLKVVEAHVSHEDFELRTPFVYGKGAQTHNRRAEVRVSVEDPGTGRFAEGIGQMTVAASWAWPSKKLDLAARQDAMLAAMRHFAGSLAGAHSVHPLELGLETAGQFQHDAQAACADLGETMPPLAEMIAHAPFDLAVHDAFGKLVHASAYDLLDARHLPRDLGAILGPEFAGRYPCHFLRPAPAPEVRISHCVGIEDPLREADVPADAPHDGLPNSLEGWIRREGLDCFKLKLKGDPAWDAQRTVAVADLAESVLAGRPFLLSVDGNEQYADANGVLALLDNIRSRSALAWERLAYVEQPTSRHLAADKIDFGPVAKLKPVIADEAVTKHEDLALAYDLGWSGFGLKAGKSLSGCLLYTALTKGRGKLLTVQDNMNTGLAHAASIGLAARAEPFGGVESNGRQFNPKGNENLAQRCPALCQVKDGRIATRDLFGPGLGY